MSKQAISTIALVYQAGIANVFDVSEYPAKRLVQADFRTCEAYARGMRDAGVSVQVWACNRAGDIANVPWDTALDDAPFHDEWRPPVA